MPPRGQGHGRPAARPASDIPVLVDLTGGDLDFITCHGVLSYVARPDRILEQFARCLSEDGAPYLGVNSETHHSRRWRDVLPSFGQRGLYQVRIFHTTTSRRVP